MCNPRRVRVLATRQLAQAWAHEIRRTVTRSGSAVGEARVREPLGPSVGGPALAALERVLADTPGWELDADGEAFRFALDGGAVSYHIGRRELEIVASVTAEVEVSADAATTVTGELTGTMEAEGEGTYYDDQWGGITEADARRAAEHAAQQALDREGQEREERERAAAEERAGGTIEARAGERAAAALAEATAARSAQLQAEATTRLTAIGIQGRNVFHQALAVAYRDAILAYARSRGAEAIRHSENGGIVDIEFEMNR